MRVLWYNAPINVTEDRTMADVVWKDRKRIIFGLPGRLRLFSDAGKAGDRYRVSKRKEDEIRLSVF
jgi:hypothetical protein